MDDKGQKYKRISKASAFLLIVVAVVFDLLELLVDWIPVVGQIISAFFDVVATIIFAIWFMMLGVGLSNVKATTRFWVTNFIEWLPIPMLDFGILTLGIILMITNTWAEDTIGIGLPTKPSVTRKKVGRLHSK